MTPKKNKGIFTYLIIILLAIGCIYFVSSKIAKNSAKTNYSKVMVHFDNFEVSDYELDLGTGELTYKLRGDDKEYKYDVPNVSVFLEDTEDYRKLYNRKYLSEETTLNQNYIKITDRSWIYSLIPVIITVILGCAILYFMMKQSGGGGKYASFAKANLKNQASARKATFNDVAGARRRKKGA